jgi:hypothetical protein
MFYLFSQYSFYHKIHVIQEKTEALLEASREVSLEVHGKYREGQVCGCVSSPKYRAKLQFTDC